MQDTTRSAVLAVAMVCAALIGIGACQQSDATAPVTEDRAEKEKLPPTDHLVEIIFNGKDWNKIGPLDVQSGQTVRFTAWKSHVWILIPDGNLELVSGETKPCMTPGFIAFEINKGSAVIQVAEGYPDEKREISYSVMAKTGDTWDYVHGANPPPRMTVRKGRNT